MSTVKQGRPRTQVQVQCTHCGGDIMKHPSDLKRNKTGRFFCSTECRNAIGSKPRTGAERPCETCGKTIYVRTAQTAKRFCSAQCRDAGNATQGTEMRTCEGCGVEFEFQLRMSKWNAGRFHSHECYLEHRRTESIGRVKLTTDGYLTEYQPDSPMAQPSTGWVLQHRLVMAETLGRPLTPSENPHHKNGDRTDNRPENLELWNVSQPSGQRVEDKVAWAREILALYPESTRERLRKAGVTES